MPDSTQKYDIKGGIYCADFIGRDQHVTTYGFSAEEVECLIEKVVGLLQARAVFVPQGQAMDAPLAAEQDGERLVVRPGAAALLLRQRSERAYLLGLVVKRDYQMWATRFIPLAARADVRRSIEGWDIPVAFSEFRIPPPGSGPEAQITTEPLDDITEALNKHRAFVILGEPGAGKTTTLQKMAYEAALEMLDQRGGRMPLMARLSQQAGRTPFDFLQAEWSQRTGTDFGDALAAGRVLLLLDGMNELPRENRAERLKAWRLFAEEYAECDPVVFTSREKDYQNELKLPRVRVDPLDDRRIADYLVRNQAEGLAEMLDDPKTPLREMARNPFYLLLLTSAYKSNQRDMANRGWLLKWFVGELFGREERLAHPGWIPRDAQREALAQMAFRMQEQGESTTLALKAALATLPKTVEFNGEELFIQAADVLRFGRAATLLDPNTTPEVRFYHHLLQEYFAALDLLRRFDAGDDLSLLWRGKRLVEEMPPVNVGEWDPLPEPPLTGWEVTTLLACGLSAAPEKLVDAVRKVNPALAGRCLTEAGLSISAGLGEMQRATQKDLLSDLYNSRIHLRARLQAGFILGRIGDPRFEVSEVEQVKVIVPQMVPVPAGKYPIGSTNDPQAYEDESPASEIELPAFRMGKWPVTNAEYACFMQAGGYQNEQLWQGDLARRWLKGEDVSGGQMISWLNVWRTLQEWKETSDLRKQLEQSGNFSPKEIDNYLYIAGLSEEELKLESGKNLAQKSRTEPAFWKDSQYNNPSQPLVGITWFEARAYCAWLTDLSGENFRLPSEAEWEAAARGSRGRIYPWGMDWDASKANTLEGRILKPSPAGAYAATGGESPFGAEDQAGNVWNWTASLYLPYPYDPAKSELPESEGERVLRGGSWTNLRWVRPLC